mmetsp:Transcript_13559/g.14738  ORF Transcript_13559/g.14738 Transcript_13559/m.14738 type:complete len:99 (+) Transcript_13559:95-391(+)
MLLCFVEEEDTRMNSASVCVVQITTALIANFITVPLDHRGLVCQSNRKHEIFLWLLALTWAFAIFTLVSVSVVPVMRGVHVNELAAPPQPSNIPMKES